MRAAKQDQRHTAMLPNQGRRTLCPLRRLLRYKHGIHVRFPFKVQPEPVQRIRHEHLEPVSSQHFNAVAIVAANMNHFCLSHFFPIWGGSFIDINIGILSGLPTSKTDRRHRSIAALSRKRVSKVICPQGALKIPVRPRINRGANIPASFSARRCIIRCCVALLLIC